MNTAIKNLKAILKLTKMKKVYKNEKQEKVTIDEDFRVTNTDDIPNFPVGKYTNRTELTNKGYVIYAHISECKCSCDNKNKPSCSCNDY